MGYRSDVILMIEKPLVGSFLTALNKCQQAFDMVFKEAEQEKSDNGDLLFRWEYIKWYQGYPEIDIIQNWMDSVDTFHEDHYSFHRLGEEFGDHESRGNSYAWSVCLNQHISVSR